MRQGPTGSCGSVSGTLGQPLVLGVQVAIGNLPHGRLHAFYATDA